MTVTIEYDYVHALQLLHDHSGYASGVIHHVKNVCIPQLSEAQTFIDIGPGLGSITRAISPHFLHTVVFEPVSLFHSHCQSLGFTVIPEAYQKSTYEVQADFILAAHLFYHVPRAQWAMALKKMVQQLKPGGMLMIIMAAPRGLRHDLCVQLNPEYPHSGHIACMLDMLEMSYQIEPSHVVFTTQSYDDMSEICRCLISEMTLINHMQSDLQEAELGAFDALISNVTHSLETVRHNYQLRQEDDWLLIHKR